MHARLTENLLAQQVAFASSRSDFTGCDLFDRLDGRELCPLAFLHGLAGLAGNRPATRQGFQASFVATSAHWTIFVDGQVANFSGRSGDPAVDLTIQEQPAADSCSNLDVSEIPLPSSCPCRPFAQDTQVGIVVEGHGSTPPSFECLPDWEAVPSRHDRRCKHHPLLTHDRTWHAHPKCQDILQFEAHLDEDRPYEAIRLL
jgi:hypothetical protein